MEEEKPEVTAPTPSSEAGKSESAESTEANTVIAELEKESQTLFSFLTRQTRDSLMLGNSEPLSG